MKRLHGGAADSALLDFSVNLNPLGPPDSVRVLLRREMESIARYPSPDAHDFCKTVADHHGISPECVLAGNGSTDLVYLVARFFLGQRVNVIVPAFTEYEDACESLGIPVNQGGETVTFLGNPSSPEGGLMSRDEVRRLAGTLVIDEAFIGFVGEDASWVQEAVRDSRFVVLRSLTKFYAIPGLRIGYLVAVPGMIVRLKELHPPWSVNALAACAGIAALRDHAYAEFSRRFVRERREELTQGLQELGLAPFPSVASYILCRVSDAAVVCGELFKRGIVARNCDSFTGLEKNRRIRFAVRKRSENERLLAALKEILEKCPVTP